MGYGFCWPDFSEIEDRGENQSKTGACYIKSKDPMLTYAFAHLSTKKCNLQR